jgi:hypothetical protein
MHLALAPDSSLIHPLRLREQRSMMTTFGALFIKIGNLSLDTRVARCGRLDKCS